MVSSQGARWRPGPAFSYSYSGLPCVVWSPHLVTAPHPTTATPSRFGDMGNALRSTATRGRSRPFRQGLSLSPAGKPVLDPRVHVRD
jgi:hypothetical protein